MNLEPPQYICDGCGRLIRLTKHTRPGEYRNVVLRRYKCECGQAGILTEEDYELWLERKNRMGLR